MLRICLDFEIRRQELLDHLCYRHLLLFVLLRILGALGVLALATDPDSVCGLHKGDVYFKQKTFIDAILIRERRLAQNQDSLVLRVDIY